MNLTKYKSKLHKLIPYAVAGIIIISLINTFKISLKGFDFSGLLNYGNAISLAGLYLAWQSTKATESSAEDAKELLIFSKIEEINKVCEERDRRLQIESDARDRLLQQASYEAAKEDEERFSKIEEELVAIATQLDVKKATYQELIAEIFNLRRELYEYKAQLAVATRLGEIVVRIDKVQGEVNLMKGNCHVLR